MGVDDMTQAARKFIYNTIIKNFASYWRLRAVKCLHLSSSTNPTCWLVWTTVGGKREASLGAIRLFSMQMLLRFSNAYIRGALSRHPRRSIVIVFFSASLHSFHRLCKCPHKFQQAEDLHLL